MAKTNVLLGALFEPHLTRHDWQVGDGPTIADIENYGYIAVLEEAGISLVRYPHVQAWLARLEALEAFPRIQTVAEITDDVVS